MKVRTSELELNLRKVNLRKAFYHDTLRPVSYTCHFANNIHSCFERVVPIRSFSAPGTLSALSNLNLSNIKTLLLSLRQCMSKRDGSESRGQTVLPPVETETKSLSTRQMKVNSDSQEGFGGDQHCDTWDPR